MAATEPEATLQPIQMFRQLGQIVEDLLPLMPHDEKQDDGTVRKVKPLTDLLRAAPQRFVPRLARLFEGDVLPAIKDMAIAVGLQLGEIEARLDFIENLPMLHVSAVENLDDNEALDNLQRINEEMAARLLVLLDPDDEFTADVRLAGKLAARIRTAISLEQDEDEEYEDDEDDEDEEEADADGGSVDPDDGGPAEASTTEAQPADEPEAQPEAEAEPAAQGADAGGNTGD
jgi:hypothetical protein